MDILMERVHFDPLFLIPPEVRNMPMSSWNLQFTLSTKESIIQILTIVTNKRMEVEFRVQEVKIRRELWGDEARSGESRQWFWVKRRQQWKGRVGGTSRNQERERKRSEVNKATVFYLVRAFWPIVHIRRWPGTKGSQLWPLGLVHWQASWPLSTPSGQDVSLSEEESHQSCHLLQEGGPLPGPETGLLSNTRKWIVQGDTYWQSKRFYWERAPGWRAVGKGTQENCSAEWLEVLGLMVMGLVSGSLWPIILIQSFLVAHASLS